jgi:hypothetical protein
MRTAYTFECWYCVAEFGHEYVTVEATSLEDAIKMVDEWCKSNYAVHSQWASNNGVKPSLITIGFLCKQ